jgi:hypothetical protein
MMNKRYNTAPTWLRWLLMAFPPLAAIVLVFVLVSAVSAASYINIDVPVNSTVFNPCNGEHVAITGVDHFTAQLTFGASGSVHIGAHDNLHVTGVGDQGNTYVGNSESPFILNGRVAAEETTPLSFSLISQGSAPNFEEHEIFHLTVNADRTVTAFVDQFTETCQG